MSRDMSPCETYNGAEEELAEPETEDFFEEVIRNSLLTKRKGYIGKKLTEKKKEVK